LGATLNQTRKISQEEQSKVEGEWCGTDST
jgi:hypothetical protein